MSGHGKRFKEAGYTQLKPLIEIDGFPMIKHVVDLFQGVGEVIFLCRDQHLESTDMPKILKDIRPDCKIIRVSDIHRKGPVDAVIQAKDYIDDDREIIVSYCDYSTVWDFEGFIGDCKLRNLDGSVACYTGFHPHMLGSDNYAFCKENLETGLVEKIKEKEPFTDNKMNEWASNGTYYFRNGKILKKYFEQLIERDLHLGGEYYVSLVYNLLIEDKLRVGVYPIEKMLQWGTPYDLQIYQGWSNYFKNRKKYINRYTHNEDTTLILPMAGKGSRFSGVGYDIPKPLIPIDGLPMVVSAVECLPETSRKIFICQREHIEDFEIDSIIKDIYPTCQFSVINYITQGQAITCKIGIDEFDIDPEKPILISACDNGVVYDSQEYQKLVENTNVDIIVWSFRGNATSVNNPDMYAWLDVDDDGNIQHVSCKKFIYDNPLTTHAIIGTMYFRKAKYFLDGLSQNMDSRITTNGEYYVDDVLNRNIENGLCVKVFESKNYICWGTPDDLLTYQYWSEYFCNVI
jgi:NDP-sugar pyrophosphorylase family protein